MASLSFRISQLLILLIRSITPFSYLYLFSLFLHHFKIFPFPAFLYFFFYPLSQDILPVLKFSIFTVWMFAESVFYPYFLISLLRLQSRRHFNNALDKEARRLLFTRCLQCLENSSLDLREVFRKWFYDHPWNNIRKENFAQWVAWAFFDRELYDLTHDDVNELSNFISQAEKAFRYKFPPGFDPEVKCIRLTLDPLRATSRPLISYIFTSFVNYVAHIILRTLGFEERRISTSNYNFWYRPKQLSDSPRINHILPLVFIHGIGLGFFPYLLLISCFPRTIPVYLVEWRHVSMQLTEHVPSIDDTVEFLTKMLEGDGHQQACFTGHSLGTTAITWMIHYRPSMVRSIVLLDPVTFLLCEPTVCYNFIYRMPQTTMELLMHYFVCRELYIAHTISCHFQWSQNILFSEEILGRGTTVALSDRDAIVPSEAVKVYLERTLLSRKAAQADLMYLDGMLHGQWMLSPSIVNRVIARIEAKCVS